MSPAFSTPRRAWAFALLLGTLIALPALVAWTGWLHRRDVYPSIAWKYGPFPWIEHEIFDQTGDVDIAFLGSSHIWNGIDTPYVQKSLSQTLGRRAEVFTLGWPWGGYDGLYTIARDLLDHRRVHMLVIDDEGGSELPHLHSSRWFTIGENSEALAGLAWLEQAGLYGGAVLGMPRHLLSLVRPNLLEDLGHTRPNFWNTYYHAPNVSERMGSLRARLAYGVSPDFVPFTPHGAATPEDAFVYSASASAHFRFTGPGMAPYQLHFARKLAQLCHDRGTQLVVLQLPYVFERDLSFIAARVEWPAVLGEPVQIIGIPNQRLLSGLQPNDVFKLFYDDMHLNQNGQDWYTPLITPSLSKLYVDQSNH